MKNKIGVVLPFQNGDLITATSCLHYREKLWGDADIVWFCNEPHSDALKFQDIEIRHFPHGWDILENDITNQYAERVIKDKAEGKPEWEDWTIIKNPENKLNQELKNKFSSFKDLDEAYFAAPWMLSPTQRHGIEYPNISKKVFGVPDDWEWHPVLKFDVNEKHLVDFYMHNLHSRRKNICLETMAGSGQSILSHEQVIRTMEICQEVLGQCNFIFMSHKYLRSHEEFPEEITKRDDVFFASHFTVRQCALIVGMSHLLISVSSGITVASSCWENKGKPFKTLQYCGSEICSTRAIAHEHFELITHDDKSVRLVLEEYYQKLQSLLKEISNERLFKNTK